MKLIKHMKSIFLIALILSQTACLMKTNETEIGVKIVRFSFLGEKGVQEEVFSPGQYHFYIPFFEEFRKLDTKLQTMSMTMNPRTGDSRFRDDLLFKTIDGNDISMDVVIQYRIDALKAPYLLQYVADSDSELKDTIMRAVARSLPRDIFGELKTEEFYIASKREEKAQKVKDALNAFWNDKGVLITSVLTDDYRFNAAYQKAIEDKKVADQQAEKNKSAQHATEEEYKKKLEDTQGQVNEMIAQVDGEFLQAKIEADAYYEKMMKIAEAIRAEGIAEAQAITELNKALAGTGGRTMVKLEIAKALKNKQIILLPLANGGMNLKTTNINDLLSVLGLKAAATQTP